MAITTTELQKITAQVVEQINTHVPQQWVQQIIEEMERKGTNTAPAPAGSTDLLERMVRVEEALKAQGEQIKLLIHQMDKRFESVDKRFESLQIQMDKRFEALQVQMDKRFEEQSRHNERNFGWLRWMIAIAWTTLMGVIVLFRFFG